MSYYWRLRWYRCGIYEVHRTDGVPIEEKYIHCLYMSTYTDKLKLIIIDKNISIVSITLVTNQIKLNCNFIIS